MSLPRATCSDEAFADYIHTQAEKFPLPGLYELRTTAAGGHVTLGGRVDSPETLRQLVTILANTPGLCELSFFGMEFCPPDIPDDVIAANAQAEAAKAIGAECAAQLGYYCEDHFLVVHGKLPSLPLREKVDAAVRAVPGVGLYLIACEVVLEHPPSDEQVVAAVRKKFRSPFELPNLTFRASQIQITSKNNVVTLTGRVPNLLGKLSAGAQAAQVEGVRYVVNRIVVPGVPPTGESSEHAKPEEPNPQGTLNPAGAEVIPDQIGGESLNPQRQGNLLILTGQEKESVTPNAARSSDDLE
ncbi:MAG: BON domain-containing protein [Planctomycetes bacterium]|nr:BON domain-containing protein [Planctomycetota bacterium]